MYKSFIILCLIMAPMFSMSQEEKRALFIYMNADQNLEDSLQKDLKEILGAKFTKNVDVFIEYHLRSSKNGERIIIKDSKKTMLPVTTLNDQNINLSDFVEWCNNGVSYNSKILFLWNHGNLFSTFETPSSAIQEKAGLDYLILLNSKLNQNNNFLLEKRKKLQDTANIVEKEDVLKEIKILSTETKIIRNQIESTLTFLELINNQEKNILNVDKNFEQEKGIISPNILDNILRNEEFKFDIVFLDACNLSFVETAYVLKDNFKYMVSSQQPVRGAYLNYKNIYQ